MKKLYMRTKLLCFALIFASLLGLLAACSGKNQKTPDESTTETPDTSFDPEAAPTPYMADFGGYEFRVLTRGSGGWRCNEIEGDAMGTTIEQAAYNRNVKVGKMYNFEVVETKSTDWLTAARNSALGGGNATFDMFSFKMNDMPSLAGENLLYDLKDIPYMHLDAAFYDQALLEQGSFANYNFFVVGDLLYQDDMATECAIFNPQIWADYSLGTLCGGAESMYELVNNGNWTLENFAILSKATTIDSDGDGSMTDKDNWGFNYENADILSLDIACGNDLLTKDQDDVFVLNRSEKQLNNLETIMKLLNSGYAYSNDGKDEIFINGRQFISFNWINELPKLSASDIDYGVIPLPKANSEQQEYRSFITTYGSNCITISKNVADPNKTASIIELLSYESRQSVTPKLSNYLFGGRLVQHPEDVEMLRYIVDHRCYELSYLWAVGSLYSTLISLNNANGEGIANAFQSCEEAVAASIARKLERFQNLS